MKIKGRDKLARYAVIEMGRRLLLTWESGTAAVWDMGTAGQRPRVSEEPTWESCRRIGMDGPVGRY